MIITKTALSRRTVLRGLGSAVALPFLDAMTPALTAAAKAASPMRLAFWNTGNGVFGPNFKPKGEGTNLLEGRGLELSPILKPLEGFRKQMVVATGLSNSAAESKQVGSGVHTRAGAAFLSGCAARRTEGADLELGRTADQYAADVLGKDTQLSSLELALESSYAGNCDVGYSCAYVNTFSWRSPTMPLPMENNPRVVFERMFGDGGSGPARRRQLQKDRSILDALLDELSGLQKRLGAGDRTTLAGYVDAVRDVEARIQKAELGSESSLTPSVNQPAGIPDSYPEHAKLMIDLMFLAYQADVTRVITFQTSREQSGRQFPFLGVPEAHHETSHHQGDPHKILQNTKINTYFVQMFAELADRMRQTPDGDGTLLDHSMLLWGAALGSGDIHSPHDMPVVVVGGGNGRLEGGRWLQYPIDTPFMNFVLGMLDKADVHVASIGDSTGQVTDL